jgi:hypothetical protein
MKEKKRLRKERDELRDHKEEKGFFNSCYSPYNRKKEMMMTSKNAAKTRVMRMKKRIGLFLINSFQTKELTKAP